MTIKLTYNKLYLFLIYIAITSLLLVDVSPIPLSVSMALMFVVPFFYVKPKYIISNLINNKKMIMLMCCFLALVPSLFYTKNYNYLFERWQIALPFLLLPIAFSNTHKITKSQFAKVLLWLALQVFLIALVAIIYYIFHTDEVNQRYLESQVMPTILTHHPTYSMLVAFSIYIIYYVITSKKTYLNVWQKNTLWFVAFFLFVFQHIYSVRIGLLALYILIFIEIARLVFISKQYFLAIIGLVTVLAIAIVTIKYSPTVQNKIKNSQKDLNVMQSNQNADHHSMAMRIISYKIALQIIKENPIWGVGLGNMKDELEKRYQLLYPEMKKRIIPHNLFLFLGASIGIFGLLLFSFGLFYGFIFFFSLNPHLLNIHYIMVFIYAMVEAGTQTQLGVAYIILPILIGSNTLILKSKSL
ncbi:MAG: O-antigen ligase family protein [Bacteroidia bacterium]